MSSYDRWLEAPYTDGPDPEQCENVNEDGECEGCANCDRTIAQEIAADLKADRDRDDPPDPRERYEP